MNLIVKFLIFLNLFATVSSCGQKPKDISEDISKKHTSKSVSKINGVSFVASPLVLEQKYLDPVIKVNANYAAIMPFGFLKNLKHPEISYNAERQWFGETMEGVRQYVKELHKNEIKVMVKPQIWIWRGEYTGYLKMENEEDWKKFEDSYRSFILDFAKLAEEENVDMYCIGTELEKFIEHRPDYWFSLIEDVKKIYKGKITYAANWDEYKRTPFWSELDFIGVDAYFPISESKTPSFDDSKIGWQRWKTEMQEVSEKANKKIIFTEYGYRSVDFAGKEPWQSSREMNIYNSNAQEILLQSLYDEVWNESWFAGGFLWKWFLEHDKINGEEDNQYTPQNKPAEVIVSKYYGKN